MCNKIFNTLLIVVLLLIGTQSLISQSWTSLQGPAKARNERDITISSDGATLYVCDKSVLFKSTNGGTNWFATPVEVGSPLVTICKPDDPNNVVVGVNGIIYLNTNGGSTGLWQPELINAGTPLRISVSPITEQYPYPSQTNQMYLGRQYAGGSSIYYSGNSGYSWVARAFSYQTNVYDIAPHPVRGTGRDEDVWAVGSDGTAEGTNPLTIAEKRGVWWSNNLGQTWSEKKMGSYNVRAIALRDMGSGHWPKVVVGTASGKISYSWDGGTSWSTPSKPANDNSVTSITAIRFRSDANHYFAATNNGVYKSTDDGQSWTGPIGSATMTDKNVQSFVIVPSSQNTMYATTNTTIYKTTDGGTTWTSIDNGLGRMPISSVAINGINYLTASNQYPEVAKYNGTSWSKVTITDFKGEHIISHPQTTNVYTTGYLGQSTTQKAAIYRSIDGGANYSLLNNFNPPNPQGTGNIFKGTTINPINNSYIYVYGKDGTNANFYSISNYGGGTPQPYTVGGIVSNTVNDVVALNVGGTLTIYYGLDNVGVYQSLDVPSNGIQKLSNMSIKSIAINPNLPNVIYAAGTTGLMNSVDAGGYWFGRQIGNFKRVIMSPGYPNSSCSILLLNAAGDKIFYSANNGSSLTEIQGTLPTPFYDIRGVAGNPPVLYAATDNGAYKITGLLSSDKPNLLSPTNGATVGIVPTLSWSSVAGASAYHLQIAIDPNFSNIVVEYNNITSTSYATTTLDAGTYYWRVAANNFIGESDFTTPRSYSTEDIGTLSLSVTTFLGGDGQIHPRLSWTGTGQGPNYYLYRYVCTYGVPDCGVWPYPFLMTTTSTTYDDYDVIVPIKGQTPLSTYYYQVRSAATSNKVTCNSGLGNPHKGGVADDLLPKETRLESNYPNPFNPTTTIRYELSEDIHVTIKVYDVLGREVVALVDGLQSAGYKSAEFDASKLPSGVYFYRMTAGKYSEIKKMMLLR